LAKPEQFTSACLVSNEIAITSERGTELIPPDEGDTGRLVKTLAGIARASPDGRWLTVYPPYANFLQVYHVPDLQQVARLTGPGSIRGVAFSPDGDRLAVAFRNQVRLWQASNWTLSRAVTNALGILFTPDAKGWWLTRDFRTAGLYNPDPLQLLLPLPVGMLPLAVSRDGRYLAVSVDRKRLQVWDLIRVRQRLRDLELDWPEP
jgi:WD40 repeat protein